MFFNCSFTFCKARSAFAILLVLLGEALPTIAQSAGFDVFTQPSIPGSSIAAGQTCTIKWIPSDPASKISLYLLEGSSNTNLQIGPKIATSIDSTTGSYDWAVSANSLSAFSSFGFKLQLDSDPATFQYSTYFSISSSTAAQSPFASPAAQASTTVTAIVSQASSSTPTPSTSLNPSSSPAPSLGTNSETSSLTISPTSSSSSTPIPDSNSSSSLSPGTKAGIGVGAAIGGLLLLALQAFIFFRCGKRAAVKTNPNDAAWDKAELGAERPRPAELGVERNKGVVDEAGAAELAGKEGEIAELETRKAPAELG